MAPVDSRISKAAPWRVAGVALAAALLVFSACAKPPAPPGPDAGALGISVVTRWDLLGFAVRPDTVFFIRLAPGSVPQGDGEQEAPWPGEVLVSNFRFGDTYFLLNAPPGRYAAVAANEILGPPSLPSSFGRPGLWGSEQDATLGRGRAYTTLFPAELVNGTLVTLGPGEFGFMGEHQVVRDIHLSRADPTQRHFLRRLEPVVEAALYPQVLLPGMNALSYRGTLAEPLGDTRRGPAAEQAFLNRALAGFAATGWETLLTRRLAVLAKVPRPG